MGTEGGCTFPLQNKADKRGISVSVGLYRDESVLASFNERIQFSPYPQKLFIHFVGGPFSLFKAKLTFVALDPG